MRFEAVLTKGSMRAKAFSFFFLYFLNQKLTMVNSTKAAKTNAVQRPIHTSIACNEMGEKLEKKSFYGKNRVINDHAPNKIDPK